DLEGRYVYANPEGERIFQKRLGELAGKTDDEVFPPETAAQFRANDQLAITTGQGLQTIEMLPQPDGIHYSIVSKFPLYGNSNRPVLVGGVAFDITEQRNAEEALRRTAQELFASNKALRRSNEELRATREQLQLITNNMAAAVTRCSSDFRYVWVSNGYAAWIGRQPEEVAGRPIREVIGAEG